MTARLRQTAVNARHLRQDRAERMLVEFCDGVATREVAVSALQDYGYAQEQAIRMVRRVNDLWLNRNDHALTCGVAA